MLTIVTSKERRAAIIALHKNGLTCKEISAKNIAPERTTLKEPLTGSSRRLRREIQLQLRRLQDVPECPAIVRTVSSWGVSYESSHLLVQSLLSRWVGVSESACTVRRRLLDKGLVSRRAAKNSLLSKKTINDRLKFCRQYKDWTAEDWCKVVFSGEAPFQLFGTSAKSIVRKRKGKHYCESCVMPTVKHPCVG